MYRDASAGFTLIEMLAVVMIVAILSAIAWPSYTDYLRRGRIAEATGKLAAMRIALEQYYQDNLNYGSTATACGVPAPSGLYFSFSCNWGAGASNQGYLITATGTAGNMSGFAYTIDQNGNRATTGLPPGWGSLQTGCWVLKKGSGC